MKRNAHRTRRSHRSIVTPHFRKVHATSDRAFGFHTACRKASACDVDLGFDD